MPCFRNHLYLIALATAISSVSSSSSAQASIAAPGDLAFVGFNADHADVFAVVALATVDPHTTIIFDESNWNGTAFVSGEGRAVWNSGATAISAGTVIQFAGFDGSPTATFGSVSLAGNVFNMNGVNEQLFAYLDASHDRTPDTFLAAISNRGFTPPSSASTLSGTGLIEGTTAISFTGFEDIMAYVGPRTGQAQFRDYLGLIGNPANWIVQDGRYDESTDGIGPDVPFDLTPFRISGSVSAVPEPTAATCWCLLGLVAAALQRGFRPKREP